MMEILTDPHAWVSLLTLTVMETVLGIDNLIFIAVLVERLPPDQRDRGRRIGIGLALVKRLALLSMLSWVIGLTTPLFTVFDHAVSIRDAILTCGGLLLLTKATREIHEGIGGAEEAGPTKGKHAAFGARCRSVRVRQEGHAAGLRPNRQPKCDSIFRPRHLPGAPRQKLER